MSGPFCETCENFNELNGECTDASKLIHGKYGQPVNDYPAVSGTFYCSNHEPVEKPEEIKKP